MPRLILRSRPMTRRRRGVTLPELLVAMFLLSVIGASLIRVFAKQQQAYKDLTLTAAAKRELRLGATVLPAELRSISSSGGDIVSMSESEMEIRAFIGTSIVCHRTWPNTKSIYIPPENLANHRLTTFLSRPVKGDLVFLYDDSLSKGSQDDYWAKLTVDAQPSNDPAVCVGPPYTDAVLDAGKNRARLILSDTLPDSVRLGAAVRFARPVRYKIYQEASGNWYLGMQESLTGAWQAIEPLAGPYRPFTAAGDGVPNGLQFRYYDTLGVRITDLTKTKDVGRVDVFLRTNAGTSAITERKGAALQDSVVMRIAIRNSK